MKADTVCLACECLVTAAATAVAATTAAVAAATAATTAAVAATTVAAAEATATGRTWFHRTGFVHDQITAAEVLAMHALDGCLCFGIAAHFDKAETLGTAGVTLHHDLGAANRAELAESLLQILVAERIGQVAHVKFVAHEGLLKKHENAMGVRRNQQTCDDFKDAKLTNHRLLRCLCALQSSA